MLAFLKTRQEEHFAYYQIIEQSPEEYDKYDYNVGGQEICVPGKVFAVRSCQHPEFVEGDTDDWDELYLRGEDILKDLQEIVIPKHMIEKVENLMRLIGTLEGLPIEVPLPSLEES